MRQQAKKSWSSNIRHTRKREDQLRYSYGHTDRASLSDIKHENLIILLYQNITHLYI